MHAIDVAAASSSAPMNMLLCRLVAITSPLLPFDFAQGIPSESRDESLSTDIDQAGRRTFNYGVMLQMAYRFFDLMG